MAPYKDKTAKAAQMRRYRATQHTSGYHLRKARDALLKEGYEESARFLEDRWGVSVSSRPKEFMNWLKPVHV